MEKNCNENNDPNPFDSPEKVAEWMREADYAFDFRGSRHWSLSGGMRVVSGSVPMLDKD